MIEIIIPSLKINGHILRAVNCLSKIKNFRIHVFSSSENDRIQYSRKIESYNFLGEDKSQWIRKIVSFTTNYEKIVVLPINYESIEFVAKNKSDFESICPKLVIPEFEILRKCNDKWSLFNFLKENSLPTPFTKLFGNFNNIEYPFLIKPTIGQGGHGIVKISNRFEFDSYLSKNKSNKSKRVIQSFIKGYEFGINVLCIEGEVLSYTIQKDISYLRRPFSPSYEVEFIDHKKGISVVEQTMKKLNWSGVAHIDMIYDESDAQIKIIEINPRFWGSVEASLAAGVNFPYLLSLSSLGVKFKYEGFEKIKFVISSGLEIFIYSKLKAGNIKDLQYAKYSLQNLMEDPLPKIIRMFDKIRGKPY
jgi:predicted ATP-grasp superfamily ATP-dependent carboligase